MIREESQLRIRLGSALRTSDQIWEECQAVTAERDALRARVQRLETELAEVCAEADRLRELCSDGMPGLVEDEA